MAAAFLAGGCGSVCEDEPPGLRVIVRVAPALGSTVRQLEVEIVAVDEIRLQTFPVTGELADGTTSLGVRLGDRDVGGQPIRVSVVALSDVAVLASGTSTVTAQVNACNEVQVALTPGGACGDGRIDGQETCDRTTFGGLDCLSYGIRPGTGGIRCNQDCTVSLEECTGGQIDSTEALRGALGDANARKEPGVVRVHPGSYVIDTSLDIRTPHPVQLEPLEGVVALTGDVEPLIRLSTDGHTLYGLRFDDAISAVRIDGANATVERCAFVSSVRAPNVLVGVYGDSATLLANDFVRSQGSPTGTAIHVVGEVANPRIVLNGIDGAFATAIRTDDVDGEARIDHNTVRLPDGASTAVVLGSLRASVPLCVRNNAIVAGAGAFAYEVGPTVRLDACDGVASGQNAVFGAGTPCTGRCMTCDEGVLCTIAEDPRFVAATLCPAPDGPLIDVAVSLGIDLTDGDDRNFTGAAPDIGARESGGRRWVAGVESRCP